MFFKQICKQRLNSFDKALMDLQVTGTASALAE
jgi:hypothetical protein